MGLLGLITSWWSSPRSSNMLTILILGAALWWGSEQIEKQNEVEAMLEETSQVLEVHDQASLVTKDQHDGLEEELREYEEELGESEYLNGVIPSDIRKRL